jgi:SAM-dependent methyltransferase
VKRTILVVFLLASLAVPSLPLPQEWHLDVPYVPTKPEVVAKMLEMAKVGKDDVLYDLGCGDGRIVITAAKLFGTRGVSIDINPERIKESRENAAAENVADRVTFLEQDLFQTDFHEASVVTLYLLSSVNLRLRPILFTQLGPGTRVVSHDFSMDAWKPDDSAVVTTDSMTHDVYFWVIPANASGTWEWTQAEGGREVPFRLELDQHFQVLGGTVAAGGREAVLVGPKIVGDRISFTVEQDREGKVRTVVYEGRVTGTRSRGPGRRRLRGSRPGPPGRPPVGPTPGSRSTSTRTAASDQSLTFTQRPVRCDSMAAPRTHMASCPVRKSGKVTEKLRPARLASRAP